MEKDFSELKKDYIPLTRSMETPGFGLSREVIYLADYVQLEQRYNLLLDYVKEKTGSDEEDIKRFVIDKWQRANSYWCRCNLDYAFASEKEIKESYNYELTDKEKNEITDKIKKIKSDYLNKYKFSIWYEKNSIEYNKQNNNIKNTDINNNKNETENELKKAKKTIVDLKIVAEYYKDRYFNVKNMIDYLIDNKFISKQILAKSKPKKLAEEIEKKVKSLPSYIKERWEIKI